MYHVCLANRMAPCLLEIKAEYLRDYLCARSMGLYITSYRSRTEVVKDPGLIKWEDNNKVDASDVERWEGYITAIQEGGMLTVSK